MRKLLAVILIGSLGAQSMAATTNEMSYGTSNQAISVASGIANNAQAGSASISNTSNLFLDALVVCKYTTAGSGTTATGTINVYAYGTADGGTNFSDGVSGSSATATLTSPPNVRLIGVINAVAVSTTYTGGPFSVSSAFNGTLPAVWGIVVENKTGGATTGASAGCHYQGVYVQNL